MITKLDTHRQTELTSAKKSNNKIETLDGARATDRIRWYCLYILSDVTSQKNWTLFKRIICKSNMNEGETEWRGGEGRRRKCFDTVFYITALDSLSECPMQR